MNMKVTLANARYRIPALEIHRDNPLICALPEKIESGRLRQLLTSVPQIISSNELNKSDRIHMARQLRKAVIPTMPYVEFNNALYEIIVAGYEQRNPLDPKIIQWSYEIANPDIDIELLVNSNQTTVNSNDTTTENLYITGLSGVGKTKLKNAVMSLVFPTVVLHSREDFDETQIVYLCIDMPHDGSRVTLLHNLIEAIDKTLVGIEKTNYLAIVKPKSGRGASIGALQSFLYSLCAKYHIGVIVIDEFQNINVASQRYFLEMLQLFDTLSNLLHVPIIKIGTVDAMKHFEKRLLHGRRAGDNIELLPYIREQSNAVSGPGVAISNVGRDWENLIEAVFQYQVVEKPIQRNEKIEATLYRLSCGLPYCLFTLWQETQIEAIRSGSEKITIQLLNQVYNKRFKLIKRALQALRKNQPGQFQELLTISQLVDKGDNDAALKHLRRFTEEEKFSGVAAVELNEAVAELEFKQELTETQKQKLTGIKKVLKQRAQPILKGQTIEHDKK